MAYIDLAYYSEFGGRNIPEDEFDRLADTASDVIDAICTVEINGADIPESVKKATAYELEMIYSQGGIDAITGMASSVAVSSESLGGYSISRNVGSGSDAVIRTFDGIPVSSLSYNILHKAGYIKKWGYVGDYDGN